MQMPVQAARFLSNSTRLETCERIISLCLFFSFCNCEVRVLSSVVNENERLQAS